MNRSLVVVSLVLFCLCLWPSRIEAETIGCNYTKYWWSETSEFTLYYCVVSNTDIFNSTERVHIDDVSGDHLNEKEIEDVQGIQFFKGPGMSYFPSGLEKVFPNLISISLDDTDVTEITKEDLKPFPRLKYFQMKFNQLTHLREDLFEYNKNLEILNFQHGKIKFIDRNALSALSELRNLNFIYNTCDLRDTKTREGVEYIVERIEAGVCLPEEATTTEETGFSREDKIKQLEAEIEALKEKVEEKDTKIFFLESEQSDTQNELQECTEKKDQAKNNQENSEEKANVESSNQDLEANVKSMAKLARKITEQITKQAADIKTEREESQAKIEKLEKQVEEREEAISECQQKLEGDSTKIATILEKLEQQQADQDKILETVGGGCNVLSTSYEKLSEQFSNFTTVLDQLLTLTKQGKE